MTTTTAKRKATTRKPSGKPATPRADIYETVTNAIIEQLETGTRPWAQSWKGLTQRRPLRHNGVPYRGINTMLLWIAQSAAGYGNSTWMTYRQATELGGQVRKGEKSTHIVYANAVERTDTNDAGEETKSRIPFMKAYYVFNVEQIDGLPEQFYFKPDFAETLEEELVRLDHVDAFFKATGATIKEGGNRAFYRPSDDTVTMPHFAAFVSAEAYAAVLAHEIVHWTGASSRLDRIKTTAFGTEEYAKEELIAELGAAFIGADLGLQIDPREDHASYIASWLKALKNDKRAIFQAAAAAERAADFLHSFQEQADQTDTDENEELPCAA